MKGLLQIAYHEYMDYVYWIAWSYINKPESFTKDDVNHHCKLIANDFSIPYTTALWDFEAMCLKVKNDEDYINK